MSDPRDLHHAMTSDAITDGARLAALRELGLLDTAPEEEFDRFTAAGRRAARGAGLARLAGRPRPPVLQERARPPGSLGGGARDAAAAIPSASHVVGRGEPLVIADARAAPAASPTTSRCATCRSSPTRGCRSSSPMATPSARCARSTPSRATGPSATCASSSDLAAAVSALLDLRRALNQQSLHDPLTGLPNRALTVAYAEQLSTLGSGGDCSRVAIGIDDLGAINEAYGTAHGDRLISLVGAPHRPSALPRRRPRPAGGRRLRRSCARASPTSWRRSISPTASAPRSAPSRSRSAAISCRCRPPSASPPPAPGSTATRCSPARSSRCAQAKRRPRTDVVMSDAAHRPLGRPRGSRLRGALRGRGPARRDHRRLPADRRAVHRRDRRLRGARPLAPPRARAGRAQRVHPRRRGDRRHRAASASTCCAPPATSWRIGGSIVPADDLQVTVNFSPLQLAVPNIAEVVAAILAERGCPARR